MEMLKWTRRSERTHLRTWLEFYNCWYVFSWISNSSVYWYYCFTFHYTVKLFWANPLPVLLLRTGGWWSYSWDFSGFVRTWLECIDSSLPWRGTSLRTRHALLCHDSQSFICSIKSCCSVFFIGVACGIVSSKSEVSNLNCFFNYCQSYPVNLKTFLRIKAKNFQFIYVYS